MPGFQALILLPGHCRRRPGGIGGGAYAVAPNASPCPPKCGSRAPSASEFASRLAHAKR
jgi:hypothetical protein